MMEFYLACGSEWQDITITLKVLAASRLVG
jgi:hypothetical protein